MAIRTGREIRVRAYPVGGVSPDDFEVVEVPVPRPGPGQVLVRNTWTSVDPGLRLRLRPDAPSGYFAAFALGRAMDGIMTVGEVVESRAEGFAPGDVVWHAQGWREYAVVAAGAEQLGGLGTLTRLDVDECEPQWYLGPLGGMGLTAYAGLHVVDALRGGETVWVSAAAGAVGSLAVQIARLMGNRVVASAGTDEKVDWLRDRLGADAFNYRTGNIEARLGAIAPDGIDVYFDSVGGTHLEAALSHLRRGGRVAMCGSISEYESGPAGPRNLFLAVSKDLTLRGFRGSGNLRLMGQMRRRMTGWLRSGELDYRETVFAGLESAPHALTEMIAGRTAGKTLVSLG
ncbi:MULTISPECIES: NADP-dependent oxidoreductase [Streptomyces]|uniref:NADP-dependent oxidoreductase n=1 Tax=Streptomyces lycopersici TaxID=2974589 RepID=UPI0021CF3987|nr:NADP-dependent oxidoreductase [Streptomyces sp. NEAU-383]